MTEHSMIPARAAVIACALIASVFLILAEVATAKNDTSPDEPDLLHVAIIEDDGAVSRSIKFDRSRLEALPQQEFATSTIWTVEDHSFSGPSLHDVLVEADVTGTTVHLIAANGYEVRMAWEEIEKTVPIVATRIDGAPYSVRQKGPLWIIFPYDQNPRYRTEAFYALSIWQLTDVRVSK